MDTQLLELLVCPKSHGELEIVDLEKSVSTRLVEKYREHFPDAPPVVEQGLFCAASDLVYPIVSEIPILLIEEALSGDSCVRP